MTPTGVCQAGWNLWSSYRHQLRRLNFHEMSFKGTSKTLVKSQYGFFNFFFKGIHSAHILKGLIVPPLQLGKLLQLLNYYSLQNREIRPGMVIIVITNFQQPHSPSLALCAFLSFSCPSLGSMVSMVYCQSEKWDLIVPSSSCKRREGIQNLPRSTPSAWDQCSQ